MINIEDYETLYEGPSLDKAADAIIKLVDENFTEQSLLKITSDLNGDIHKKE